MTPSEFWHGKHPRFDSPIFRDWICSLGCIAARDGDHSECYGEIHPHHVVFVSHGGSDLLTIPVCATHHGICHSTGTTKFLLSIGINDVSELHQKLVEGFLRTIGAYDGEIVLPKAIRKPKKSTKRPVGENKKAYVKQSWQ